MKTVVPPPDGIAERLGGAWLPIWTSGREHEICPVGPVVLLGRSGFHILVGGTQDTVLQGRCRHRWFDGGQTNVCFNCVDRHVADGHGAEVGLVWEGNPVGPRSRNSKLTGRCCKWRSHGPPTRCESSGLKLEMWSPFSWGWFRSSHSPCWPALELGRCTP